MAILLLERRKRKKKGFFYRSYFCRCFQTRNVDKIIKICQFASNALCARFGAYVWFSQLKCNQNTLLSLLFLHLRHFLGLRQISNYRSKNYRLFDIDSWEFHYSMISIVSIYRTGLLKGNSVSHTDQFDVSHDPIEQLKIYLVSHT